MTESSKRKQQEMEMTEGTIENNGEKWTEMDELDVADGEGVLTKMGRNHSFLTTSLTALM